MDSGSVYFLKTDGKILDHLLILLILIINFKYLKLCRSKNIFSKINKLNINLFEFKFQ